MAEFRTRGLGDLMLSLEDVAKMPEDVQDEMLNAGADALIPVQRKKILAYGIYDMSNRDTRHVADSISKGKVKSREDGRVIYVYPRGTRKRGKKTTRNAAIMYVNEYGKRGQKGRPAIRDSSEEAADGVTQAEARVWDAYLKKNNL